MRDLSGKTDFVTGAWRAIRRVRGVAYAVTLVASACARGSPSAPHAGGVVHLWVLNTQVSQGDTVIFAISFSARATPGSPLHLRIAFNGEPLEVDTARIPRLSNPRSQTPPSVIGGLMVPPNLPDGTLTLAAVLPKEGYASNAQVVIKRAWLRRRSPSHSLPRPHVNPGPVYQLPVAQRHVVPGAAPGASRRDCARTWDEYEHGAGG